MIDTNKIRLMTKIAIHEKKYNSKDRKINEYYRNDYIYRKNAINRFFIFIGLCFLFLFITLDFVYIKQMDFFTLDYKSLGIKFGLGLLSIFVCYTVIGMFKYGREYDNAQKRYKKYFSMLNALEKHNIASKENFESIEGGSNERDFSD